MEAMYKFMEAVWHGLLLLGSVRGLFYILLSLICKFQYVSGLQQHDFIFIFFLNRSVTRYTLKMWHLMTMAKI